MCFRRFNPRQRLVLVVSIIIIIGILAVTIVGETVYRRSAERFLQSSADRLADSLMTAKQASEDAYERAEEILEQQMLNVAALLSEMLVKDMLTEDRVQELAQRLSLDEINITNSDGVIELTNGEYKGWRFSDDPEGQAYEFRRLIDSTEGRITQKARPRDTDRRLFKYVGVSRRDQPGIVQVGVLAEELVAIREQFGIQRAVEQVVAKEPLRYAFVVDGDGLVIAHSDPVQVGTLWIAESVEKRGTDENGYPYLRSRMPDGLTLVAAFESDLLNQAEQMGSKMSLQIVMIMLFVSGMVSWVWARFRQSSFRDRLTSLYTRSYFEEELRYENAASAKPFSILIGDVNGLKAINETYGQGAGDEVLKKIASVFKRCFSNKHVVARWGGDSFIVLLRDCDSTGAQTSSQHLKNCLAAEASESNLSVSLGISTRQKTDTDVREVIQRAENRMFRHKLMERQSLRNSLITSLEESLRERDYETEEHAQRLRHLTLKVGKLLGLGQNQLDDLALLSALHDIGKLGIPDSILMKPGPLTDEEWEVMKKHTEIGFRIASASLDLTPIAQAILSHHERYDGKGYPRGLAGKEIPLIARILTIADAYDVMTNERPYKGPISSPEAIQELTRCVGGQFDPELVEVFIRAVETEELVRVVAVTGK